MPRHDSPRSRGFHTLIDHITPEMVAAAETRGLARQEVGGGVFPLNEYADEPEPEKAAYADAQAEGEAWLATR